MNNFTIVFIHGYTASSKADWYPNISSLLRKKNIPFVVPDLPGGEHPHAEEWLETLHKVIEPIQTPIVLVGHSLGTRTALLYLEKYQPSVEKVFLIAAFANDGKNTNKQGAERIYNNFFTHKIDLSKLKPLVDKFIVMHSEDDPDVEYSQGVAIAKDLNAKLITYENYGHMFEPKLAPVIFDILQKETPIS